MAPGVARGGRREPELDWPGGAARSFREVEPAGFPAARGRFSDARPSAAKAARDRFRLSTLDSRESLPRGMPRLRRRRPKLAPIAFGGLAVMLFGFGVAVLAAQPPDLPLEAMRSEPAPVPQWVEIMHPFELFSLDAPELGKEQRTYRARRHSAGGGRSDTLGFGTLGGASPFLRLTVYRRGQEEAAPAPFFVDLARGAAAAGLSIGHSLQPQEGMTRFGPVQVADVDLVGPQGAASPCLGFRSADRDAPVKLSGFACGSKDTPMSRPGLTCLIERLDLTSAGDDAALASFFAKAELQRNPACSGTALAPVTARSSWLDQPDARPQLRTKKTR
jgi:hypothetical protein